MFSIANKHCLTKLCKVRNNCHISKFNNQIVKFCTSTKTNEEIHNKSNNPNEQLFNSDYKGYITTAEISQKLKKLDEKDGNVLMFKTACITVVICMILNAFHKIKMKLHV